MEFIQSCMYQYLKSFQNESENKDRGFNFKLFIKQWTGASHIPKKLNIKLINNRSSYFYPRAQTCFNRLLINIHMVNTYEDFRVRVNTAVQNMIINPGMTTD